MAASPANEDDDHSGSLTRLNDEQKRSIRLKWFEFRVRFSRELKELHHIDQRMNPSRVGARLARALVRSICVGRLRDFFAAMKEEPSVDGILFQARFGTVIKADNLQRIVQNKLIFGIPDSINLQSFLQNHCAFISEVTRYKIQFKMFADDASSLEKIDCHIEEEGDTFTHVWTRISVKDELKDTWRHGRNVDIICPGRHIDMRIVSHFNTPCCPEDHPARKIAERIAKSMTRTSGSLSMQVAAQDFCVVFIRKKIIKTYSWIDPDQRKWTITDLCVQVHKPKKMEDEYLRLRREKRYSPFPVNFNSQVITELDFSGNTHATKPSDDPERKMPTPDEFVADFKALIEASFCVADQMEKYLM